MQPNVAVLLLAVAFMLRTFESGVSLQRLTRVYRSRQLQTFDLAEVFAGRHKPKEVLFQRLGNKAMYMYMFTKKC